MVKPTINQQLKELKDILTETNEKITAFDQRVTNNHNELMNAMERIVKVEKTVSKAYQNPLKNEQEIFDIKNNHDQLKNQIDTKINNAEDEIKQELNIKKLETQLRGALMELENLRNRSMRSTLIFKNVKEENNERWDDTARILCNYIVDQLDLNYTYDEIDSHIIRAHRGGDVMKKNQFKNSTIKRNRVPNQYMLSSSTGEWLKKFETK